jgi:predicted DNA binding protein
MYEVILKLSYDETSCNLSRRFSSLKMLMWCNRYHDVIEVVVKDPTEHESFIREVPKPEGTIEDSSDRQSFHIITKPCSCMREEMSIVRIIGKLDILHISPVMVERGWQYHRIVVFRHKDFEELLRRLGEAGFLVEVLRKVPFEGFIASSLTLNADALFSALTDKQMDALLTAHRFGYFNFPRRADVQEIAATKHVPRTTYSDNLKKAEGKLVSALIPYIRLFRQAPKEKRLGIRLK